MYREIGFRVLFDYSEANLLMIILKVEIVDMISKFSKLPNWDFQSHCCILDPFVMCGGFKYEVQ
jgi:hypothetical protein